MHAVIPFGKDMLTFLHRLTANNQANALAIDEFLKKYKIKVVLSKSPTKLSGSWHVRAIETFTIFQHFEKLCKSIQYKGPAISLVKKLLGHFKTLYKWEFITEEDWKELGNYQAEFPVFLDKWREDIVQDPGKYRNYWHALCWEIPESIYRKKSAWKYSSDITETYVCLIKNQALDFTTRGGLGQNPCVQLMERMTVHSKCYERGLGSHKMMISPYEKKKLSEIMNN